MVVDLLATSTCWLIFMFKWMEMWDLKSVKLQGTIEATWTFFKKLYQVLTVLTQRSVFYPRRGLTPIFCIHSWQFIFISIHTVSISINFSCHSHLTINSPHEQSKKKPGLVFFGGGWNPTHFFLEVTINHEIFGSLGKTMGKPMDFHLQPSQLRKVWERNPTVQGLRNRVRFQVRQTSLITLFFW